MNTHNAMNDADLLEHSIAAAGDEWLLAKALGRSFRTVSVWRSRKALPQGIREHLYLLLEYKTPCACQAASALPAPTATARDAVKKGPARKAG